MIPPMIWPPTQCEGPTGRPWWWRWNGMNWVHVDPDVSEPGHYFQCEGCSSCAPAPAWPKEIKLYCHSSKDSRRSDLDENDNYGLSEEAQRMFLYSIGEVEFTCHLFEDGIVQVVSTEIDP